MPHPPYGRDDFGQVGAHAAVPPGRSRPTRSTRVAAGLLAIRGTVWPKAWDVESTYGEVNGNASGYLSAGQWVTLAVRGGGKKVFGDYPYFDAASLGGGGLEKGALDEPGFTLRGFHARRFSGDSSLYGNADLRLRLGRVTLILPAHFGVFGLFDVGPGLVLGRGIGHLAHELRRRNLALVPQLPEHVHRVHRPRQGRQHLPRGRRLHVLTGRSERARLPARA